MGIIAGLAVACNDGVTSVESAAGTDGEAETGDSRPLDPACAADDSEANAGFGFEHDEPTEGYGSYDFEVDCLISSLEITGDFWGTQFDCSDEDAEKSAYLSVGAVAGERPDWAEGDEVRLRGRSDLTGAGGFAWFEFSRDGVLLGDGVSGDDLHASVDTLASWVDAVPSYEECGAPMPGAGEDEVGRLGLQFAVEGTSVVLISGERLALDVGGGRSLQIDVGRAESGEPGDGFHRLEVLRLRTVAQD